MTPDKIRIWLAEASPESFENAKQESWFNDALHRVHAISNAQQKEYMDFGCSEEISEKLVKNLVTRLSVYFAGEKAYSRLVSSTQHLT